jgi:arsenate reductase-like glutaredoxin family protein
MKKIYHLKTCDTCKRILKQIRAVVSKDEYQLFKFQEIKTEPITVAQLEEMYALTNSYESLFSKRAKKYKQMDLKNQVLTEKDYKQLILEEYTFLKRPVIIIENEIFVGNSKKNVDLLLNKLSLKK